MPKRPVQGRDATAATNGTAGRDDGWEPRRSRAKTHPEPGTRQQGPVIIAGVDGTLEIASSLALRDAAEQWQRIIRNRVRWTSQRDARDAQAKRSKELLESLGVDQHNLEQIAESGVVQVSVPYVREKDGWEQRIFPWEYILSSATREHCARPPVIVRRLMPVGGASRPEAIPGEDPTLVVESAPGEIRTHFLFDSERQLVRAALGDGVRLLPDPTERQLNAAIRSQAPAVIHLAGIDSHQGSELLGDTDPGWDGYYLANDRGQPTPVEARRLGNLLAAAKKKPRLVTCNFYNSAARIAAMAVASGAAASVGFQDTVDDSLAELFFSRFYANWAILDWATIPAFVRTLDDLRSRPGVLTGLGIVIWSDQDIIADGTAARIGRDRAIWTAQSSSLSYPEAADGMQAQTIVALRVPQPESSASAGIRDSPDAIVAAAITTVRGSGSGTPQGVDEESDAASIAIDDSGPPTPESSIAPPPNGVPEPAPPPEADTRPQRLVPGEVSDVREPPAVWADPKVRENVNFVNLHNNGSLFDTFRLRKGRRGNPPAVEIQVTLFLGRRSFPYKATRTLTQPVTELRDEIRVPLTADLLRSVHETIQSVVYIRVRQDRAVVHEITVPVWIASASEWMDTDEETRWLPSFVLPSDPAVDQIRQRSLPALRALDDSFNDGFLGYQALGPDRANPRYDKIDVQANAIWSTLSFLYELTYVNPPPTYTERAQRLRTPSAVVSSHSGTCIDLALLFAACLEAIDLYPVILMFEGHANVGYWRSPDVHQAFQTLQAVPAETKREWQPKGRTTGGKHGRQPTPRKQHDVQVDPWELRRQFEGEDANLNEVLQRIDRQDLAVLETTLLTQQAGFGDAIRAGRDSFQMRAFRSLVDIRIARKTRVTPLPIRVD